MSATTTLDTLSPDELARVRLAHGHAGENPARGHGVGGPADKRIIVGYGFWLFILSDIVMFSAFFATYAVQRTATAGGPGPAQLFHLTTVAYETAFLLISSFLCGMAMIAAHARNKNWALIMFALTALTGMGFLFLEFREFAEMIADGNGPHRSGFLSAFFTLVGCHGAHVTFGTIWLFTMMAQIAHRGFRPNILRRLLCFALFWHALDIIWVALMTVVYLIGVGQ